MEDSNDLTPRQDINPQPLARRDWVLEEPGERRWLSESSYVLRVSADDVLTELTANLALVAPVGMTEEDRTQWLVVAMATIAEMEISPVDFAYAVKQARRDPECDHPAKIVPAVIKALGEGWTKTIRCKPRDPAPHLSSEKPKAVPAPLTAEELAKAYARLGEPALKMALKFGEVDEATCEAIRNGAFATDLAA